MKLFHGSNQTVESPNLTHSRDNLDFGRGFISGVLSKEATLVQLKVNQAYDQIVFLSECALDAIKFEGAETVQ